MSQHGMKVIFIAALLVARTVGAQQALQGEFESLSRTLVDSFSRLEQARYRNTVAVLDFENASDLAKRDNLGFAFSELLTGYLVKDPGPFRVLERKQLTKVLDELEFSVSDLADQSRVANIGKITGADLLIVGSVFLVGNEVQVNVKLVETETSQILLSETIRIPKSTFVEITQYLVELRSSLTLGYEFLFLDEISASSLSAAYMYSFSRGLSLEFQLSLGMSHGTLERTVEITSPFAGTFFFQSRFYQIGLAVLFGVDLIRSPRVAALLQLGPLISSYMDRTTLTYIQQSIFTPPSFEADDIAPTAFLFGVLGSAAVDFSLSRHLGVIIGAHYQWLPDNSISKTIEYRAPAGNPISYLLVYNDKVSLTGFCLKAGLRYSF